MASGPTQNYDDASLGAWHPHPALAVVVRVVVVAAPPLLAIAAGLAAVHWFPPARLGVHPWAWLAGQVLLTGGVLLGTTRLAQRLLPLATLLRLTLFFPDRAPSRMRVALRRYSPAVLEQQQTPAGRGRPGPAAVPTGQPAAELLALVRAIGEHDRTTQGHSERVQAYAALIGREMGLSAPDAAKLSWAALLHDVGKLDVPAEILDKTGRPTDEEWHELAQHPHHGMRLAAPLADWLGPWLDAIGQHHERWDGRGYPAGLAGTEISRAARIVAVADAYDVITSARSYKKPLSASAARAELARCAGSQFDPEVVRAFLAVGLGRLQLTAGPISLLAALPGLRSLPVPSLGGVAPSLSAAASTVGSATTAVAVGAALSLGGVPAAMAEGAATSSAPVALDAAAAAGSVDVTPQDDSQGSVPSADPTSTTAAGAPTAPAAPSVAPSTEATAPAAAGTAGTAGTAQPATVSTTPGAPASPAASPTGTACERAAAGATALGGANLTGCDLSGRTLSGVDLSGANLTNANLHGAVLTAVNLAGANLTGATLRGATLVDVQLVGAGLHRADLRELHAGGGTVTLASADLSETDLSRADLSGVDLSSANLRKATARETNLSAAVLSDASAVKADLREALLMGANLSGTDLDRADLDEAVLTGATGLPVGLGSARWDETVCPDGAARSTSCF